MKRFSCAVALLLLVSSCLSPKKMISVDAIGPALQVVIERHDEYVKNDNSLTQTEKDVYLRTTKELNDIILEAGK